MLFKKNWREVYNTSEIEKFYKAQNVLKDYKIDYKTDIVNNNLRLSMNNVRGTDAALSRGGGVKDFYRILVDDKEHDKAKYLLSKF